MRQRLFQTRPLWAIAAVLALAVAPVTRAQETEGEAPAAPALSIEEIVVEPASVASSISTRERIDIPEV